MGSTPQPLLIPPYLLNRNSYPAMSTIETFRVMSGIKQTSSLEITPERAEEIIQTVSSNHSEDASTTAVNLLPVSSYVTQAKPGMPGMASIIPNMPPLLRTGVLSSVSLHIATTALLLHLVLEEDEEGRRSVHFLVNNVGLDSKSIRGGEVKQVGETRFDITELIRIGEEMISAFGNYHVVFWNCQMFAKCYLRVITGSDATFSHWTTADVTNLFLCAFVIPTPIASSSKSKEQRRMRLLQGWELKLLKDKGRLSCKGGEADVSHG